LNGAEEREREIPMYVDLSRWRRFIHIEERAQTGITSILQSGRCSIAYALIQSSNLGVSLRVFTIYYISNDQGSLNIKIQSTENAM